MKQHRPNSALVAQISRILIPQVIYMMMLTIHNIVKAWQFDAIKGQHEKTIPHIPEHFKVNNNFCDGHFYVMYVNYPECLLPPEPNNIMIIQYKIV